MTTLPPLETLHFYLPFPDGALHYVCAECDALCCRGQGFGGSLSREMTRLLALYPALESAVTMRRGDIIWLQSPTGRCFFLQDDKRCRIEREHGKQSKPGVCGLFPFNKFNRIGDDIVVISPHFLCPLRLVVPAKPNQVEGTHSRLIEAAKASGMIDAAYFASSVQPMALALKQKPAEALAQEERFLQACTAALTQGRFFEVLRAASVAPEALEEFVRRASLLCGVALARPAARDGLDDLFLALASSWRIGLLQIGAERLLRVLALAEILVRRVASISGRPMTPQQANHCFSDLAPMLRLLSRNEETYQLPKRMQKVPPFGSPPMIFAAFRALRGAEQQGVMAAFEKALPKELSTADRMAILVELGAYGEHAIKRSK